MLIDEIDFMQEKPRASKLNCSTCETELKGNFVQFNKSMFLNFPNVGGGGVELCSTGNTETAFVL